MHSKRSIYYKVLIYLFILDGYLLVEYIVNLRYHNIYVKDILL
jgi:hypothetical protein